MPGIEQLLWPVEPFCWTQSLSDGMAIAAGARSGTRGAQAWLGKASHHHHAQSESFSELKAYELYSYGVAIYIKA